MPSKPLIKSKTFWVNLLTGIVAFTAGPLGAALPTKYTVPAVAAINIALRFLTTGPVHLLD